MADITSEILTTKTNSFVRAGHILTRMAFGLTVLIFIAAPILAISWRNVLFPGFFVEHTLIVNQN